MAAPPSPAPRSRATLARVVALVLALAVALGVAFAVRGGGGTPHVTFHGVKLGMTPGDVRARFTAPSGAWRATSGSEMVLDYSPDTGDAPKVRFEFHSGMLVAVRATLTANDAAAGGQRRELTPGSVLVREPAAAGRVSLVWLSRDCPTHKDEATRLALP